jgi:hypothetical protein
MVDTKLFKPILPPSQQLKDMDALGLLKELVEQIQLVFRFEIFGSFPWRLRVHEGEYLPECLLCEQVHPRLNSFTISFEVFLRMCIMDTLGGDLKVMAKMPIPHS